MRARRDREGNLHLDGLPFLMGEALRRLPDRLRCQDPRVRDRLQPPAYSDPEEEKEWRRLAAPELDHLFQTRLEVVEADLRSLRIGRRPGQVSLILPKGHDAAWLASLNAARLTVFLLHRFRPADMEVDPREVPDPDRAMALVEIHLLAFLQELILSAS